MIMSASTGRTAIPSIITGHTSAKNASISSVFVGSDSPSARSNPANGAIAKVGILAS